VAYALEPGRGDGTARIYSLQNKREFNVERGSRPVFSEDAHWVGITVKPGALDMARADSKDKPKQGLALVNTRTGKIDAYEKVQNFFFSKDSRWLAFQNYAEKAKDKKEKTEDPGKEKSKKPDKVGSTLILLNLSSKESVEIPYVLKYSFDDSSRFLAYVIAAPEGRDNGLFYVDLNEAEGVRRPILQKEMAHVTQLVWSESGSRLGFVAGVLGGQEKEVTLWVWEGKTDKLKQAVTSQHLPPNWYLPEKNPIRWSKDGERLFFGFKPEERRVEEESKEEKKDIKAEDLFDVEKILTKSEVDVWHWNDPFINPHQKNMWSRVKDQTFPAVYHFDSGKVVPLADLDMPQIQTNDNPEYALGLEDAPYRKLVTWYGELNDLYLVNLKSGVRKKIVAELEGRSSFSPEGRYVAYYQSQHWFLYDCRSGETRNLTADMEVPFYNEDHDYPRPVPGYGVAGWIKGDSAVLIYDKYDIWSFSTHGGSPINLTAGKGRAGDYTFRILNLNRDEDFFEPKGRLLLSAYHNQEKYWGFYACQLGRPGVEKLLEKQKRFRFLAKAKEADTLMFTQESYEEFPDLWVSDGAFSSPQKVSEVNPQIQEFAWGKAELVEWESVDGIPLQGVLIKPGNYQAGTRYPVIVYYYRFFSQRLHEFNQTVINHRPNFPFYASNGYAVFLPDIRFAVGLPGFSATKCLVPGIQKLVDMGVADPDAIGLHGHSWSGYQTAFVVTQTDIFKCAVAGAPVSNMTSAYSGIRWGSGLARQFQYEQQQSRIGASLWERRDLYIDNSPVFFADRINTPLLIIFGDEDGAVPWYQGIELYLALRRLEKDCIFLQYRGEPHHPQKYPNKLDWFKKMKEYFDHYLKGMPGPDWISEGQPYRGK
ncbi:MAG: prolyl oligopeptidase family serine peptidase, partial [Candidatus Aminicenantes bacterium]|nr:prolyl oligopeptidase family serine peptidase [Candidatus Aminicenantes bacterium]